MSKPTAHAVIAGALYNSLHHNGHTLSLGVCNKIADHIYASLLEAHFHITDDDIVTNPIQRAWHSLKNKLA